MGTFYSSFLPNALVAKFCYRVDRNCRKDLFLGNIVNEGDYVSNLMYRLRTFFLLKLGRVRIFSRTLNLSLESLFGCDAIIIFKKKESVKIGMFEAKYPRVISNPTYNWDKISSAGLSHFSDQINRQHFISTDIAIWEMIFLESYPGTPYKSFDLYGSSCIWHQDAFDYMNRHSKRHIKWDNSDLNLLLTNSCTNLYNVVLDILSCHKGVKKKIDTNNNSIKIEWAKNEFVDIPLPLLQNNELIHNELIDGFLKRFGLKYYLMVDIK